MSRQRRVERAEALQGLRAGFVSRILALAIDIVLLILLGLLILAFIGVVRWLVTSEGFSLGRASTPVAALVTFLLATSYFGYCWVTTGRTAGEAFLGLRTVRLDGGRLPARTAYLRGALYVIITIGLLWILISRTNASIQDLVCRTCVIYDWSYNPPATA